MTKESHVRMHKTETNTWGLLKRLHSDKGLNEGKKATIYQRVEFSDREKGVFSEL